MSLDTLLAARKAKLAAMPKRIAEYVCGCGSEATWRCAAGVWRCARCEKRRLAAECLLPPGIRLED